MKRLNIKIDRETHTALKMAAAFRGETIQQYVSVLIKQAVYQATGK